MAVLEEFAEKFLLRLDRGFNFGDLFFGEPARRNCFCRALGRIGCLVRIFDGCDRDWPSRDWRGDCNRLRRGEGRSRRLRGTLGGTEGNWLRRR